MIHFFKENKEIIFNYREYSYLGWSNLQLYSIQHIHTKNPTPPPIIPKEPNAKYAVVACRVM